MQAGRQGLGRQGLGRQVRSRQVGKAGSRQGRVQAGSRQVGKAGRQARQGLDRLMCLCRQASVGLIAQRAHTHTRTHTHTHTHTHTRTHTHTHTNTHTRTHTHAHTHTHTHTHTHHSLPAPLLCRAGLYVPTSDVDVVVQDSGCLNIQEGLRGLSVALSKAGVAKSIQARLGRAGAAGQMHACKAGQGKSMHARQGRGRARVCRQGRGRAGPRQIPTWACQGFPWTSIDQSINQITNGHIFSCPPPAPPPPP